MIIVKLLVFLFLIVIDCCYSEYCEICLNHTLCKYPIPGPGASCVGYDNSALLTTDDIESIVNRINERRNFVALGLLKNLPQAANMMIVSWSEDLAWSAQRWVDQCDPSVRPDKFDYCRNLEDAEVGQNIATIFGPAPGLNVKSFVDIWFMDSLDYSGSVSFYNRSQDHKTNFFTQLIWADTDAVGCGKAKFYLQYRNNVIERLVCNFASKGNTHGRPVYAIGFPATQCPSNYGPDKQYRGLCTKQIQRNERKFTLKNSSIPSLLEILNLSNNSVEHDLDPIKNNFFKKTDSGNNQRRQKIRHVSQNSFPGITPFIPQPPTWNSSRSYVLQHLQHEKGHSRLHHGHNLRKNVNIHATASNIQDLMRYDFTTERTTADLYANDNLRKSYQYHPCSRNNPMNENSCCSSPLPCITNKCTRGQGCVTSLCPISSDIPHTDPHSDCPCTSETHCPLTTSRFHCCDLECCPCSISTNCHGIARVQANPNYGTKKTELHYYDLFPDLTMRSGDTPIEALPKKKHVLSNKRVRMLRNFVTKAAIKEKYISIPNKTNNLQSGNKQITNGFDNLQKNDYDYSYGTFDSSERIRRGNDEQPIFRLQKTYDGRKANPYEKKSRRFTTLAGKRNKKSSRSISKIKTEPITIRLTKSNDVKDHRGHSTENFLSFEELMRLKKINVDSPNYRRQNQNQKQEPKPEQKPEPDNTNLRRDDKSPENVKDTYTTMTPFDRKKYCTRKLTCTWTQMTKTASDGSIINHRPIGGGGGSRTPPGYVSGCTRTVTCTRMNMDRNKADHISTDLPDSREGSLENPSENDEDYCERRSLEIRRRDSDEDDKFMSISQNNELADSNKGNISSEINDDDCSCNDGCSRKKREIRKRNNFVRHSSCNQNCDQRKEQQYKNPFLSYGDLYYLVLKKLIKSWRNEKSTRHSGKCPCNNNSAKEHPTIYFELFILYIILLA